MPAEKTPKVSWMEPRSSSFVWGGEGQEEDEEGQQQGHQVREVTIQSGTWPAFSARP